MTNDLAMKYDSLKLEILANIDKISNLGINLDSYKEDILEVDRRVNKKADEELVAAYATASYDSFYAEGMQNLKNINQKLNKYDKYLIIYNSCNWVESVIKEKINIDELKECVSEIIYSMKSLLGSGSIKFEHEAKIVNKVYEVAYQLIKLEILMTGESNLYKSAVKDEVNYPYFSRLILKDIDNLCEDDKKALNTMIYKIEKNGINANYFDFNLIGKIVYLNNKDELEETVIAKLKSLKSQIEEKDKDIFSSKSDLENAISSLQELKKDSKKKRAYATTNAISLALSSFMLSFGIFAIPKVSSKLAEKPVYEVGTEIYSTLNDGTKRTTITEIGNKVPQDSVYIRRYVNGQKSYLEYDLSTNEVQFDSAQEYYDYGLDNFGVDPTYKENKDLVDFTLPECIEVIKKNYTQISTTRNDGDYFSAIVALSIIYASLIVFLVNKTKGTKIGFISSAADHLFENIDYLISNKANIREYTDFLQRNVDKCLAEIRENEVLREKYNELFKANMYLLDDYPELAKRLEDVIYDTENIKKYKRKK